ncbi:efflux RND transporter periplasmic adaptor subunit [Marinomonas rhizomae]|uniref:Membrane fusion protein (Multidrug efflux system) n=1 Tax=Marinomonas rhizomae TaxID=491948 RepID=A0A366IW78_9GAMM|nr:efflux RND transporter periplasmic adaptor subunit [Marinomonas rhizomae]RBP79033.1 membrane fusion protein (multidrug efflux system) [Marinomonas rhizomae]RNF71257.1 efflux RND transporter periplasmic adaptor subunit [Marinomonas rhizomae]
MTLFSPRWTFAGLSALLLTSSLSVMAEGPPSGQEQPIRPVGVVTMALESTPVIVNLPGRAVAYEQADIRPRVDGIIIEKLYEPGTILEKGTPLFQLDDSSYQAAVAADEAAVAEAKANLPVKQAAYDRAKKLEGSGYTSDDVDTAKSALASAQATLQSAEAALKYTKIQLGWTTVTAPIKGIADVASLSLGDLVTSAQTDSMTTITTLDPIFVDVLSPVSDVLKFRHQVYQGDIKVDQELSANLLLDDGVVYRGKGTLITSSPTVSTSTGSVKVRFRFDNPDHVILPGMFVRGSIELGTQEAFLVPQRAGSHEANGNLSIFVVDDDNKVKAIEVETIGHYNNNWIVKSGLSAGEKVIVDGQKSLSEGTSVKAINVTINDDGTITKSTQVSNKTPSNTSALEE